MAKNENKTITVNDVEHNVEDLTEQQIVMCNHIADLDKKLGNLIFNMDQLKVGREAFINMLAASLAEAENVEDATEEDRH
jgi:ribosomal protein S11